MPEIRYVESKNAKTGEVTYIPYEVSDEQLADEQEALALAKADELIDAVTTLAQAKVFLKRLVARLIKKGLLP